MKVSVFLVLLLLFSEASFAEDVKIGNWYYSKSESEGTAAYTYDEGQKNLLSVVCHINKDECIMMLSSKYQCKEQLGIPAIIAIDGSSLATKVGCTPRQGDTYPVLLSDRYEVNGLIAKGAILSIAFPAGDGSINNYQFNLNGAVQAIIKASDEIKIMNK